MCYNLHGQTLQDSLLSNPKTTSFDTLSSASTTIEPDSILQDSIRNDTIISKKKISPNAIEKVVTYKAVDSIRMDIKDKKAYLYHLTEVYYDDMELDADYNEIDFQNNELYASGTATEDGHVHGHPVFKQGGGSYNAREIKYNFTTQKGKITHVITNEGEGYIHGAQIKKLENHSFIKDGKYTTCDLDHPHFEIKFNKAKIVPNDKIVTGAAYLSFGDVPTFLAIPFGFFPIQSGRASGFIMPSFGERANMGFSFEGIGFYFGISDNIDLALTADIFTRGSWAVKAASNYIFRYKCSGNLQLSYAQNFAGEKYTPSYIRSNDFKIYWSHQQDPKSHPVHRFSSHVNFITSNYNRFNPSSAQDYLSNQYSSKITFSTNAKGIFFFSTALSYDQNTQTKRANISLPDMSMSINQFYPFRKKNKTGALKWYDNISLQWSSQFNNQISTTDSLLLKPETWQNMRMGMVHRIPLTIPIKIAKLFNWNTSVNFTERFYFQTNQKLFMAETDTAGIQHPIVTDVFKRGFHAMHDLNISTSIRTKVFFMYQFKKGGLLAIRHVMDPDIGFSYRPNLSGVTHGTYFNSISGQEVEYALFESAMFGIPSNSVDALARLSISNNLEIKVRSKKDTITGTKKVVIIENLNVSMNYNFAADSLKWSPLSITGRTTLFKQLYLTFLLRFDPYCIGENGRRINQTEWDVNKRLFRLSSSDFSVALNWTIDQSLFNGKKKAKKEEENALSHNSLGMTTTRPDFDNPWSLTLNYTFAYNSNDDYLYYMGMSRTKYVNDITQTLNVRGDVSITKKWKVGMTSGYDFKAKKLTYTSLDIYRDLHCWEMRFNWIPFGFQKGFSFTINVKASVLQDLKYNMKRDFRDNMVY